MSNKKYLFKSNEIDILGKAEIDNRDSTYEGSITRSSESIFLWQPYMGINPGDVLFSVFFTNLIDVTEYSELIVEIDLKASSLGTGFQIDLDFDNVKYFGEKDELTSIISLPINDINGTKMLALRLDGSTRITVKNIYLIEKPLQPLLSTASLTEVMDRWEKFKGISEMQKDILKNILISKGIEVTEQDTISTMIDKLSGIKTGKKFAVGQCNKGDLIREQDESFYWYIKEMSLDFRPSTIIIVPNKVDRISSIVIYTNTISIFCGNGSGQWNVSIVNKNYNGTTYYENGFKACVYYAGSITTGTFPDYTWYAFE